MESHPRSRSFRSPVERVVQAVAVHSSTEPLELPPLYDALDPDALDALARGLNGGELSFRYAGYLVAVRSDGTVDVTDESVSGSKQTD